MDPVSYHVNLYRISGRSSNLIRNGIRFRICIVEHFLGILSEMNLNPQVMGIINATPDSFSGDGLLGAADDTVSLALHKAWNFVRAGATWLDIGGESTRPGSSPISSEEELDRIAPIVQSLHARFPNIHISIDTTKSEVAEKALQQGAQSINDVSGFLKDPSMMDVAVRYGATIIISHSYRPEHVKQKEEIVYHEDPLQVIEDVCQDLQYSALRAISLGIPADKIILDPGIGFGKSTNQNLILVQHLDKIKNLGHKVLLGVSRKSFIGHITQAPVEKRLPASLVANLMGIIKGADILRVHDVEETVQAIGMWRALNEV